MDEDKSRRMYSMRFTKKELEEKIKVWKILAEHFFQRYIEPDFTVLDLAAGYCEFINNIKCRKKIAIDINGDIKKFANPDVEVIITPSTDLSQIQSNTIDLIFISNFLEHLRSAEEIDKTISEVYRVLKKGGMILILQPNIRYAYKNYWDFFDHVTPLSDRSMIELLLNHRFRILEVRSKFLPYSTKSRLPKFRFFIILHLYLKPLQWIFGKQMFIVGQK